ncbi:hypothetical protein RvY_05412 [Ramazzottius varieornatus]|uniref:Uncharacterized protein n=1 Tax=Ramazzottius varieornatus TaxID=947166 RepID=A0A1D1V1L6_RAMVA|nr:hypothetical protein RvY_05412 [Ramazzottius varieornatus]
MIIKLSRSSSVSLLSRISLANHQDSEERAGSSWPAGFSIATTVHFGAVDWHLEAVIFRRIRVSADCGFPSVFAKRSKATDGLVLND